MKSTSFIQDQKHVTKSQRFQPIKPELIESVLSPHGFKLASLKTGRAVLADRANHQTTIARYRSATELKIGGNYLEIVAKVPHLYGAVELFLGTYRVVCSNGLVVGTKFSSIKIKHLGNPVQEIEQALPLLVAQENAMVQTIQAMQERQLSQNEITLFAYNAARSRLSGVEHVESIFSDDLLDVKRLEDQGADLYSVMNVVQENLVRHKMRYTLNSTRGDGTAYVRNATARGIGERSIRSIELNAKLWDLATEFLRAA